MRYVLVKSRHKHKALENVPALFDSVPNKRIYDFDYHKKIIHERLKDYKEGELVLYVTGLTPLLISTVNYCRLFSIDVVLKHYDKDINKYVSQSVV